MTLSKNKKLYEQVVPFAGGSKRWSWTVKHTVSSPNPNEEDREESPYHTENVVLPNNEEMRQRHMTRLMSSIADDIKTNNPAFDHVHHFHADKPIGRLHGSHWVDDNFGYMHTLKHIFEPLE